MTKITIDIEYCRQCPYSRNDDDDCEALICIDQNKRFPDRYEQKPPDDCSRRTEPIPIPDDGSIAKVASASVKGTATAIN